MSDETLSDQIARLNREELNAARAEAVLAFAESEASAQGWWIVDCAKRFNEAQGWSETPGQAERGKP